MKTHHGVQSEFSRITHNDPRVDAALRRFLGQSYRLKSIADYFSEPEPLVTMDEALEAVATAKQFVAHFVGLIDGAKE